MKAEVAKTLAFEAAHRLPNVPPEHKCARMHGHSFKVEVVVEGAVDERLGWVVDFEEVADAFAPLHAALDHRVLNDIEGLENPTSENLARWIWVRLRPRLPGLCSLTVHETCSSRCTYRGG